MTYSKRIAPALGLLLLASTLRAEPAAETDEFFEKRIRPVLVEQCYSCHSAGAPKLKGGLRVDSRGALLAGGDSGPAIVPGKPEQSKFVEAIGYKNVDLLMPPKAKLDEQTIADFAAWVRAGAKWPGGDGTGSPAKKDDGFSTAKRKQLHWAWKPIVDPPVPEVRDPQWALSDVDRFILARLEEKRIAPAPTADAHVLLRRIFFDLTGLPPTAEDATRFEKEYQANSQAAVARLVDQISGSPHFGERWGRHWLDLVRYGESRGHEFDPTIPNAWQYRDYVIRALNADVPYNQFVLEHVAGDLLESPRLNPEKHFNESILGPGFWHLGEEVHSPVDIRGDEADRFDNRIDVFSKTFFALTVSCARCHDHKFDAISTKDYYSLYGFLRSTSYRLVRFESLEHNRHVMADLAASRQQSRAPIQKAIAAAMRPGIEQLPQVLRAAREAMISGKAASGELSCLWEGYLQKASRNPNDPFYLFALLCSAQPEKRLEAQQFLASCLKACREMDAGTPAYETIVDYSNLKPGQWLPDDAGYGASPVMAGQPRFSADPARPITRFYERHAAELDPVWRNFKTSPHSLNDIGALGAHTRAGRTLHTPGFTIGSGKVHYLVRGNVLAYAAVDGHTVINGPLHGQLVLNSNTAERWRWVTHDLTPYAGHHCHVEFSPNDEGDFAVAAVVQGEKPSERLEGSNRAICQALPADLDGVKVAEVYARLLEQAVRLMEEDKLAGASSDMVKIANWLLDNAALLGVRNWTELEQTSGPFIKVQAKLSDQIQRQSSLALSLMENTAYDEKVFIRGSHKAPGETAPRRLLEALVGPQPVDGAGSGRLQLAQQMLDPNVNPFISRVAVNRVWHHLFGRGLVASTDNFGVLGERPTHPELLDHLAARFVREGWSMKRLIRELMLTRTYQMASHTAVEPEAADPENLLWHRARMRRLQGEVIRDALLQISGRLNDQMYGTPVLIHLTPFLDGRGRPASGPLDGEGRRSIYLAVRRNFLSPMMLAFDTPSPFSTVGRRTVSNVPAQALIMMNDPFVHLMAEQWGQKLAATDGDLHDRIGRMYREAFGRAPTAAERDACLEFLQERLTARDKQADAKAWGELAHVLINVKEFIFIE